jgi:hypothetical protein
MVHGSLLTVLCETLILGKRIEKLLHTDYWNEREVEVWKFNAYAAFALIEIKYIPVQYKRHISHNFFILFNSAPVLILYFNCLFLIYIFLKKSWPLINYYNVRCKGSFRLALVLYLEMVPTGECGCCWSASGTGSATSTKKILQCCKSDSRSGRIRTFMVGSGSGRLGPDPVLDPHPRLLKLAYF